ncbi:MAG TPA: DUF349 domain-containing protein [Hydrogenophaga sp.]|uniref:DUF349 domain-containing protein n=1 Tax=Hydrogenophaga sp. TaxID=1904254 RepID=UPI002C9F11C3|nr:DUF349 domain-containing protein [Hydrogenophaga sp.]HMN92999.1 DUF349 domain-containing protein [Hydrogenophaga sp.]
MNPSSPSPSATVSHLDSLTGGVFSAPTTADRATRIRAWLEGQPSLEHLQEVFKELSHRDRGAAKLVKERLDEVRRLKGQEALAIEWAQKARDLLAQTRLNLADALAWQRDAARAGAPLSREPLNELKTALADRVRSIEDLQHRIQVEREAAFLLAQRIEVLSTKSWRDATQASASLDADVSAWTAQADSLSGDHQWASVDPRFAGMLETSRSQLSLVWEAFQAALAQAVAADADPQAPLPQVPVWAEELRQARGEAAPETAAAPGRPAAEPDPALAQALQRLEQELAQGHGKAAPKAAAEVRSLLKGLGRHVHREQESRAHALLAQAGELEGWQRWRADQLREELVAKAEALLAGPEGQRPGGRKIQETLRSLREQWKSTDHGGAPNQALWKRFDEACNRAHKVVEEWLTQLRHQSEAHKAQRLAIIDEVRAWIEVHREDTDWKGQVRALHGFSERWRNAGHLGEKLFAELQAQWKQVMHQAHERLEAAQAESTDRRRALIEEAQALSVAEQWRIDAVKDLQKRWQAEAHAVPLDRRQEQKLWDAFRQPIDAAFARKDQARTQAAAALSAHDQAVMAAAKALDEATASGDAGRIRAAMAALEALVAGRGAASPAPVAEAGTAPVSAGEASGSASAPPAAAPRTERPLVAVRGDDRPGGRPQERAVREERRDGRRGPGRDTAPGGRAPGRFERADTAPRGPRLGDAAFRAQRQAMEAAQAGLRKLAAQAHGEVLTQLLAAWSDRDPEQLPGAQVLGTRVGATGRSAWASALRAPASASAGQPLLRLEMAAELPTPAAHLDERRQLQLQLLTRRNEPGPAQTWVQDVGLVLQSAHDAESARRLQAVLKVLMRR